MAAVTIPGISDVAALVGLAGSAYLISRGRAHCEKCGRQYFDPIFWRSHDLCAGCRPVQPGLRQRMVAWAAVCFCLGLIVFWVAVYGAAGRHGPAARRYSALTAIAAMVAGYLAGRTSRAKRQAGPMTMLGALLRHREGPDLRAARKSAAAAGALAKAEGLTVWAEAGQARADELLAVAQATEREFVRLTGLAQPHLKLRILAFEGLPGCGRYMASWGMPVGATEPLYMFGRRTYTLALCAESCQQRLYVPGRVLAGGVALALAIKRLRAAVWPWLADGLCSEALAVGGPWQAEPSARRRQALAAVARGQWLPGSRVVAVHYGEFQALFSGQSADRARLDALRLQFWALVHMLVQEHLHEFHTLIRTPRVLPGTDWPFSRVFGFSADEAMQSALARLTKDALPPHREPPDALKWQIDSVLVPQLAADSPPEVRLRAARVLGSMGYLWRAEALIELLSSPDENLHLTARTALEDIAGELVGDNASAWQAWLERARAAGAR